MRTALLLLKMLHERFPWPHDVGGHNIVMQEGKLRLYVFVGMEDNMVCWQSVELEETDLERNAVDIFRDIAPMIEAADRTGAIKKGIGRAP